MIRFPNGFPLFQRPDPAAGQPQTAQPQSSLYGQPPGAPAQRPGSAFDLGQARPPGAPAPAPAPAALPGPVALNSPAGQSAVNATYQALGRNVTAAQGAPATFTPHSVERDQLGMTHVRMDRTFQGLPVYGQQVVAHFGANGGLTGLTGQDKLTPIPASASAPPQISAQQAIQIAQQQFGTPADRPPTAQLVIKADEAGQYHKAYQVELGNTTTAAEPSRMSYFVDAGSGRVLDSFNKISGFPGPKAEQGAAAGAPPAAAAEPITVGVGTTTVRPIRDFQTTTAKLDVGTDMPLDKLTLGLNINHTWRGDLVVSLTSPSGKTATISNRQGGAADNLIGEFDLSSAFKGENAKGTWTLNVTDAAGQDQGSLNNFYLFLTGVKNAPAPAPTPTPNPGPAPGPQANDQTIYSGQVALGTTQNANGTFRLEDPTRGGLRTLDAGNVTFPTSPTQIADNNNVWGETGDAPRTRAGVDAQYGAQMTHDFLRNVLGRNSIDGNGERLTSLVHVGSNYNNAYWDGSQMNYGDGDGRTFSPLTTLDIAGHEIAHGLTERTAGLQYAGESGGLNEAMSDIFGSGVEWYAAQRNPAVQSNFTIGEQAYTPGTAGDALRYMADPTRDGFSIDHYSRFTSNTDVHSSSGIANNAFHMLANGGTNRTSGQGVNAGIGMQDSLQIFYRALAFYLTPSSSFHDARTATAQAAADLFGANSAQAQKVNQAWNAVGVF
ncbi:MAG TPA: M4 family metallopeptidase [Myxococcaceae bacterium]|jgi:Zn-dependent metalloprotease/subtilisin-like proprotein convertase family protein